MRRCAAPLAALVLITGCSSASTKARPTVTQTATQTTSSSPAPICPNQESGGSCIGRLSAGRHHSEAFAAPLAYRVPAGWSNEEDINGRYLLLPPGATRLAADEGTGDFVAAYTPVMAAARDCSEDAEPGVAATPAAIAAELAKRPGITASAPKAVRIGALSGSVVDVRLAAGWTMSCPKGDPPEALTPTITGGFRPELVNHAVVKGVVVRFYLLTGASGTVVIELQDAAGGRHLDRLDAVARTFDFS